MIVLKVVIEGLILCLFLYLTCLFGIRKGAVNMVYLYEKKVQDRVVELGLTTSEKIKSGSIRFKTIGLIGYFGYAAVCVFAINGARGLWPTFAQFVSVLLIMGVFDRIFIDWLWVGHTKAWIIPGTEDLMPYIPVKVHLFKWFATLIVYPVIILLICFIVSLFLK